MAVLQILELLVFDGSNVKGTKRISGKSSPAGSPQGGKTFAEPVEATLAKA
jgi:hypothetical protein